MSLSSQNLPLLLFINAILAPFQLKKQVSKTSNAFANSPSIDWREHMLTGINRSECKDTSLFLPLKLLGTRVHRKTSSHSLQLSHNSNYRCQSLCTLIYIRAYICIWVCGANYCVQILKFDDVLIRFHAINANYVVLSVPLLKFKECQQNVSFQVPARRLLW